MSGFPFRNHLIKVKNVLFSFLSPGSVTFNGQDPKPYYERLVGYCLQHDNLMPNLTVRETLQYAAALRLPGTKSFFLSFPIIFAK